MSRIKWRKSSRSGNGSNCIEVGLWYKSSRCGAGQDCVEVATWNKSTLSGAGQNCVEVAHVDIRQTVPGPHADLLVLVRDSKDPDGPVLTFGRDEWDVFLDGIKSDNFYGLSTPHEA